MKKHIIFTFAILALFMATSCSETIKTDYTGKNIAYLSVDGDAVLSESDEDPLVVNVDLTVSSEEQISLSFKLLDDKDNILNIEQGTVTIEAGEKNASFKIFSNNKEILADDRYISVGIAESNPADMEIDQALRIRVRPNPQVPPLTDEQRELIEHYRVTYGVDLTTILGIVPCKVRVESPADGYTQAFADAFEREIVGKTVITLSEESTPELPVLKMVDNPLGLTEYMYWVLKKETVENYEFWNNEWVPANMRLMEMIEWTEESTEFFSMELDGIKLHNISPADTEIEFWGEVEDMWGDMKTVVDFDYSFTAWDRQKKMLDEGNSEMTEIYSYGASANPQTYLFTYSIGEDEYWDPTRYFEATGDIDFKKGEMNFKFVFDHECAGGYSHITVNYSTNR